MEGDWLRLSWARSIRKYLLKNSPSRAASGFPQVIHARGFVGSFDASMRVRWYFALQHGHRNSIDLFMELIITYRLDCVKNAPPPLCVKADIGSSFQKGQTIFQKGPSMAYGRRGRPNACAASPFDCDVSKARNRQRTWMEPFSTCRRSSLAASRRHAAFATWGAT